MTPRRRGRPAADRASSGAVQGKQAGANGTDQPGAALLVAALAEVKGKAPHWSARCPCHDDTHASLIVDVKPSKYEPYPVTVLVFCPVCHASLTEVCATLGVECWRVLEGNEAYRTCRPAPPRRRLHNRDVNRWCTFLVDHPEILRYVTDVRGVSLPVIDSEWIGYDEGLDVYTLPVYAEGGLANVRRYSVNASPGRPKIRNTPGYGTPARLYPSLPPSGPVVVCEGEWDALVLRSHGLSSVTSTHGAATFLDEWVPLLAGRHVAFVFDCDDPGRKYGAAHAAMVGTVARSVRRVDLDPSRIDGWDVSDWFNEGRSVEELRGLINRTVPLGVGK